MGMWLAFNFKLKRLHFAFWKRGLGLWQSQKSSWMIDARPVHQGNLMVLCMSHWVWSDVIRLPFKSLGFQVFKVWSFPLKFRTVHWIHVSMVVVYWPIFVQFSSSTGFNIDIINSDSHSNLVVCLMQGIWQQNNPRKFRGGNWFLQFPVT